MTEKIFPEEETEARALALRLNDLARKAVDKQCTSTERLLLSVAREAVVAGYQLATSEITSELLPDVQEAMLRVIRMMGGLERPFSEVLTAGGYQVPPLAPELGFDAVVRETWCIERAKTLLTDALELQKEWLKKIPLGAPVRIGAVPGALGRIVEHLESGRYQVAVAGGLKASKARGELTLLIYGENWPALEIDALKID